MHGRDSSNSSNSPVPANPANPPMPPSTKLALCVFIAVAGFFLWTEHKAHVQEYWIYAVFLLCPLMHIFMHGKHGSHGGHEKNNDGNAGKES